VDNGYLIQERSSHDRRMTRVRLSEKGLDFTAKIDELYQRNADALARGCGHGRAAQGAQRCAQRLERYWSRLVNFTS
jgi:DNA-binding MarR family transcriptional regulator